MILTCSECHGTASPKFRLCITAPCGHLVHESCMQFLRKKTKLLRALDPADGAQFPRTAYPLCPRCGSEVHDAIVVFYDTNSVTDGSDNPQSRAGHLQRKVLVRLSEIVDSRKAVVIAGSSCALRFEEISSLKTRLTALNDELTKLDRLQQKPPSSNPCANGTASSEISQMTQTQLASLIRELHSRLYQEKCKMDTAQKLLATKRQRFVILKAEYDAQRANGQRRASARRAETVCVDPELPHANAHTNARKGHVSPALGSVSNSRTTAVDVDCCGEVIDVDDESCSDSDVEIIEQRPPKSADDLSALRTVATLLPAAERCLPSYDVGSGRSLMDFPRSADATFQIQLPRHRWTRSGDAL